MSKRAAATRCASSPSMARAPNESRGLMLVRYGILLDSCARPGCTDTDARCRILLPSFGDDIGSSSVDDGLGIVHCADNLLSPMWMRSAGALVAASREAPQRMRRSARRASRPATPRGGEWVHRARRGRAFQNARQPKLILTPTYLAIEAVARARVCAKASDRCDPGHDPCRYVPRGTDRTRSVRYRRTSRSVFRMIVAGPIQVDRSVVVSFPRLLSLV
jgi:hypothetical protein